MMDIIYLLWSWWNVRNKVVNGERFQSTKEVVHIVQSMTGLESLARKKQDERKPGQTIQSRWTLPPPGVLKINCDGAFISETKKGAWGFVIRDHDGEGVVAGAGNMYRAYQALHAETVGCLEAVKAARDLGISNSIIETDCMTLVKALQSNSFDHCVEGRLFREIRQILLSDFHSATVRHCNRVCNNSAHSLAQFALTGDSEQPLLWVAPLPNFVNDYLIRDLSAGPVD